MEENTTKIVRTTSRRKKETPEQRRKKKIIQISFGVLVFIVIIILAAIANKTNPKAAFILMIGTALGYILQRSRFCFTAALRDPVLTGGTNLTKAVLIALGTSSLLFMAINMSKFGLSLESLSLKDVAGYVRPVGIHTIIGAFMFGIGAVIAGGCASGTVMRIGEGFVQQWIAIIFFMIGSMLGVLLSPMVTIKSAKAIFIPQAVGGWIPAIIIQFGLLLLLFIIADMWGKRKSAGS